MPTIIRIIKIISVFILFSIILFFSVLGIIDYAPQAGQEEKIPCKDLKSIKKKLPDTIRVMTWNIGYAGLGKDADFFNEGGQTVRMTENKSSFYLDSITAFLHAKKDLADFIMLQEVDLNSDRSFGRNQFEIFEKKLAPFYGFFAVNYDVKFIPVPFRIPYEPYGRVNSGLASFSEYGPQNSIRIQYPGRFGWPKRLFMPDRCALEQKFPLKNGKNLLLINTHNTAYDEIGEIRKMELDFMVRRYAEKAKDGDYIIIGGDWNQCPPGISPTKFYPGIAPGYSNESLKENLFPKNFRLAFDPERPTNRSLQTPYITGKSYVTLIDFFLVSENIEVLSVRTLTQNFRFSDHEPVLMTCIIRD